MCFFCHKALRLTFNAIFRSCDYKSDPTHRQNYSNKGASNPTTHSRGADHSRLSTRSDTDSNEYSLNKYTLIDQPAAPDSHLGDAILR